MPVLTGIRKVEYQQTYPSVGPFVRIWGVQKVVYRPVRWVFGTTSTALLCDGYLVLDNGNDTPEQLADLFNDYFCYGSHDLFVYYTLGKVNRRKQFKDVLFCSSFHHNDETFFRIGALPDVGQPANQQIAFILTFDCNLEQSLANFVVTING